MSTPCDRLVIARVLVCRAQAGTPLPSIRIACRVRRIARRELGCWGSAEAHHGTRARPAEKLGRDEVIDDHSTDIALEAPEPAGLLRREPQTGHFQEFLPHAPDDDLELHRSRCV